MLRLKFTACQAGEFPLHSCSGQASLNAFKWARDSWDHIIFQKRLIKISSTLSSPVILLPSKMWMTFFSPKFQWLKKGPIQILYTFWLFFFFCLKRIQGVKNVELSDIVSYFGVMICFCIKSLSSVWLQHIQSFLGSVTKRKLERSSSITGYFRV